MNKRRPIMTIVKEVTRRLKLEGCSIRKLESEVFKLGFTGTNRGKLIRTFYTSNKNQQDFLNSADETIEAVLTYLNITEDDLFISLLAQSTNVSKEMIDFFRDPESKPFLIAAYNKYRADKLEKEIERLKKQIEELNQ